jgi:adenine-specific DNA methylase
MDDDCQRAECRFDVEFISPLALAEKQIQQAYRPYIQLHKWFARRPGALFRALLLAEFGDDAPVRESYYRPNRIEDVVVYDPFMGGGTPILEANRLGINTVGNDINPMATWLVRQSLTDIDLEAFDAAAQRVVSNAEERLERFYQTRCQECGDSAPVKYFIWVKTHDCEACNESIELFPGYRIAKNVRHPKVVIFCPLCRDLFERESEPDSDEEVTCASCEGLFTYDGPAARSKYECPACGHRGRYGSGNQESPPEHSLVALEYHCHQCKPAHDGRFFKAPDEEDLQLIEEAKVGLESAEVEELIPDDVIPAGDETSRLHRWGYTKFSELFNQRQLLGLTLLMREIKNVEDVAIRHALATVFSDFLRYQNMLARYDTYSLKCQDIFAVHGFPVGLVQCENNVLGIPKVGSGGYRHFVQKYRKAKTYCRQPWDKRIEGKRKRKIRMPGEEIAGDMVAAQPTGTGTRSAWIECRSSTDTELRPGSIDAVITDPPYFDNLQYAELIDFCYVWLRRLLGDEVEYFKASSTRTANELTGNKTAGRDLHHFTSGISSVYKNSAEALRPGGLFAFTYHHNDPDAYLPLVVALCDADLTATASIPCPAEMSASLHIAGTSSSVVDTILCARADTPSRSIDNQVLFSQLASQIATLRNGEVDVTEGDARCMALGLLTVATVNELIDTWKPECAVEKRIERAKKAFRDRLDGAGGLEEIVTTAFVSAEDTPRRTTSQLALFGT